MGGNGFVLECRGLRRRFGERVAVDGVGFTIAAGETYGLLGPNGAGKTTTISMVCGLLTRDEGEVFVEDNVVDTTSENAQQTGSFGVFFGLITAALGGCMVPLEVFPPAMRAIAHVTPHAWALDAFTKVLGHEGTVADILPQLGVLALYAAVLLGLVTFLFRRKLTA